MTINKRMKTLYLSDESIEYLQTTKNASQLVDQLVLEHKKNENK